MEMSTADSNENPPKVRIWVKLFVLFHLVAITVWAFPVPTTAIASGRVQPSGADWVTFWNAKVLKPFPPLRVYAKTLGFWQYWDMFAPDPARVDRWGDAEIIYKDGKTKRYAYPRMADLSIWERYLRERYRKFFERAGSDQYVYFWPTFALRIALLNDDPTNPPVTVNLYRHWKSTAPIGKPQPEAYNSALYFTYSVDQSELARLRKMGR